MQCLAGDQLRLNRCLCPSAGRWYNRANVVGTERRTYDCMMSGDQGNRTMTVKERLHQIVEAMPEDQALQLVQKIEKGWAVAIEDIPANFTLKYGVWQDSRSVEEIVRDIRADRTSNEESSF